MTKADSATKDQDFLQLRKEEVALRSAMPERRNDKRSREKVLKRDRGITWAPQEGKLGNGEGNKNPEYKNPILLE